MLSWITDAFVLLPLRECRYVASQNKTKRRFKTKQKQNRINDRTYQSRS